MTPGFESRWLRGVVFAITALAILIIYLPPFYPLGVSFNPVLQPALPSPGELTLKWYVELIGESGLLNALRESLLIACVTAVLSTALALGAALAYLEINRLRGAWFLFVLLPMFVPGVIQGLALSVILGRVQIAPFWGTVGLGHLMWSLPFAFTVILTSMVAVKRSYLLAAADLGAGWRRRTRDVVLPLVLPGIMGAVIFSFLLSLNELARASYLVGRQNTLPLAMFGKMSSGATPVIYALSGAIFIVSVLAVALHVCLSGRWMQAR